MPDHTTVPDRLTARRNPPSPLCKGEDAWAIPERLTARQIAEAKGITERGVRKRASREGWPAEAVVVRGGQTLLFPVASLPADVRLAVTRHYARLASGQGGISTPIPAFPLPGGRGKQNPPQSPFVKGGACSTPSSQPSPARGEGGNPPGPLCKGERIPAPALDRSGDDAANSAAPFAKAAGQAGAPLPASSAAFGDAVCVRERRAPGQRDAGDAQGTGQCFDPHPGLPPARGKEDLLPAWAERIAKARADLVGAYWKARERASVPPDPTPPPAIAEAASKSAARISDEFLQAYNSGLALPALFQVLGQVARSTLERWRKDLEESGFDYAVVAPRWGRHRQGSINITDDEARYLFSQLLHQNRIKVGTAINVAKFILDQQGLPSPSSPSTLRRAVEAFKDRHNDLWTFYREGEKALIDKVLPYLNRDDSQIDVGDVLVADGHRCNFFVHNPFTGKKCRPVMVGFYDWKSRVLVGWAFALEENVQCISAAMRAAILRLGKIPKIVLLDNGKAFKAKVFTGDIDLEQAGILGMFARLGIKVVFAWPYNARAKTIERFFQDFGASFERYLPNYSGASIGDKPASLSRNEKLMKAFYKETVLTVQEATAALTEWHKYHRWTPHPTVAGKQKGEVFEAGRGPGVDEAELRYLMLDARVSRIGRNGVTFMKADYMDDALYGLRGEAVVRYDFEDLSRIFVYTVSGEFICEARRLQGVHPMAQYLGEARDVEELKHRIGQQKSLKKQTTKLARQALRMTGGLAPLDALPWHGEAPVGNAAPRMRRGGHEFGGTLAGLAELVPGLPERIEKIQAEHDGPRAMAAAPVIDANDFGAEPVSSAPGGGNAEVVPLFRSELERYFYLSDLRRELTAEEKAEWEECLRDEGVKDYISMTGAASASA